ncbi:MAG: flagellar biosynthetic protein FliO [Myxococcales bacterium]|nr:flagellar biosynthetic protein FliO [Myxococcales bacterium]
MRMPFERRSLRLAVAAAGLLLLLVLARPLAGAGLGFSTLLWGGGLLGLWWWRRRRVATPDPRLRCLERLRLSGNREVCLIEIDGRRLLLGCGEGGMRVLSRLPEPPASGGAP